MKQIYLWPLILLLQINIAYAFSWADLWFTPDQQGNKALKEGKAQQAASLFDNKNWQGVAYYQAKDYSQAVQAFTQDKSAEGFYNQGNALAQSGLYQQAIAAYDLALKQQPQLADAAYNKKLIEQLLKEQNQQKNDQNNQQQDKQQNNKPQKNSQAQNNSQKNNPQQDQQQENNSQQKEQEQNSSSQNKQPQSQQQQNAEQQDKQQQDKQPQNSSQQNTQQQNDRQQNNKQQNNQALATESGQMPEQVENQWLQSIPDDPGGLLEQKFLRDHMNYQQLQQQGRQPW